MAFTKRFLMSLFALPSCLTVLPWYMWILPSLEDLVALISWGFGTFGIITSVFFLANLQANLFIKVSETGFLLLMVMSVRYSSAWSSAKSRFSYAENNVYRMPLVWSSVVRYSTQAIAMLKRSADTTHPCLTLIFIPKLRVLTSACEVVVNALNEKK